MREILFRGKAINRKMTRAEQLKEKIVQIFEETRRLYPSITDDMLCDNGAIYYMNGNDGTDFDWNCNHRLCEFFIFHNKEKGEIGFIKLVISDNDTYRVEVYPSGEMTPKQKLKGNLKEGDALFLYNLFVQLADNEDKFDCQLNQII